MKKRVLILINFDAGLYNLRMELVEALIKSGYELHFSVPNGERVPLIEATGAIFHPVDMNRRGKNPLQDLWLLIQYFKILKDVNPSIVLTYTAKPNIYGGVASAIMGIPQLGNITGMGSEMNHSGFGSKLLKWMYRVAFIRIKKLYFQNTYNRDVFINNQIISKQLTDVLPGSGVNIEKFKVMNKSFREAGRARFLFISRIMKDKGIEEFLWALSRVKKQRQAAEFGILGFYEGDIYQESVESEISKGNILFCKHSPDVRIDLHEADCVVLPTYHEGMSNVILEAAASGIPVIVSDIPGCREAVIDGVSGFLCKPQNKDELLAAMIKFIDLDAESKRLMGLAGRRIVENQFDRKKVINRYIEDIQRYQI